MTRLTLFKAITVHFFQNSSYFKKSLREKYSNKKLNKHHCKTEKFFQIIINTNYIYVKELIKV